MKLEFHPVSELFPLMDEQEFRFLCEDIKLCGQKEPIILHPDGRILDGRNRYRACQEAGVEPLVETWDGKGDALAHVLSLNLYRRHLTESQRSMVAARVKGIYEEAAKRRMAAGGGDKKTGSANLRDPIQNTGKASEKAAEALNVSPRSVEHASTVLKSGDESLIHSVDSGQQSVSKAAKEARERAASPAGLRTESEARALAIKTGKSILFGNRYIPPMTEEEESNYQANLQVTSEIHDSIEEIAKEQYTPEEFVRQARRFSYREETLEFTRKAIPWLQGLLAVLEVEAKAERVAV